MDADANEYAKNVAALATRFRQLILAAIPMGDHVMDDFPRYACGDTAELLGEFFRDQGLGEWTYRSGMRADGLSHGWLAKGGLIVDITADQFPEVPDPVIVTRNSEWYERFSPMPSHPAGVHWDGLINTRLETVYRRILGDPSVEIRALDEYEE